MTGFWAFFTLLCLCMFFVFLVTIPIMIAKARGVTGGALTTVVILSWLGIFFGVTWVIALILSLVFDGNSYRDVDNLDRLEKLGRLYKEGAINKKEFETMKAKLMDY